MNRRAMVVAEAQRGLCTPYHHMGRIKGGGTDCLMQRGAARVAAVDVAYGQIDVALREDPRVTVIERHLPSRHA